MRRQPPVLQTPAAQATQAKPFHFMTEDRANAHAQLHATREDSSRVVALATPIARVRNAERARLSTPAVAGGARLGRSTTPAPVSSRTAIPASAARVAVAIEPVVVPRADQRQPAAHDSASTVAMRSMTPRVHASSARAPFATPAPGPANVLRSITVARSPVLATKLRSEARVRPAELGDALHPNR